MKLWNDGHLGLAITRLGGEYLLAMLALGALAVHTGNNLLYLVFSLMVGLFLVSGWVSRAAIRGLRMVQITEGNLFVRMGGGVRVQFRDRFPGRVRCLQICLICEGGRVEPGYYAGGRALAEGVVVLQAHPERRGWWRVSALELRTSYPFGFLEKSLRLPIDQALMVLPHPRSGPSHAEWKGEAPRTSSRSGAASPDGARPFRIGDPPARIHWKRTAQRGEPWVREFEEEVTVGVQLRLDLQAWRPGIAFEHELERLSGAILHAHLKRREVFLEIFGREGRRAFQGRTSSWRALALAQAEGS
ncbi:DUF58 domain-containing protein [Holophaga foetida]|uniref:DUF58 domain-containing protein n=1 Tax=Holophaga foetida TaxID=35839 RepID=UPI000247370E|nr:DUF58 domain-containing protein [Holophaga foetida]